MLHRNLPLKAAAVFLAIFLWFWVMLNEENPILEELVHTSVVGKDLKPGLALQRELSDADVRLRGLKGNMADIKGAVEAFVSCRGLGAGSYRLGVQVRAPKDVTVIGVHPADVSVVLEDIVSANRPVELQRTGDPPAGYELVDTSYSPKMVRVSGAQSQVDRAARVLVTVDLARVVPGVPISLSPRAVDSSGDGVRNVVIAPPRVTVMVEMHPVVVSRTLAVVVRTRGVLPAGLELASVQVDPAMVTVVLPASHVGDITQIDTEELSLSGVQGSFTRNLRLIVPEGANLMGDPEVRVTVKIGQDARPAEDGSSREREAELPPS
jgi:YbbR domain-containing protein